MEFSAQDNLTALETLSVTSLLYLGYMAIFIIGLGFGLFLGGCYLEIKRSR